MTPPPESEISARAIDGVIFDYGEVLCLRQPAEVRSQLQKHSGLDERTFNQQYWEQRGPYDGGHYSGERYWQAIAGADAVALSDEQVRRLIALDTVGWSSLDPVMLDWARRLQQHGIKTAVLSNMQPDLLRHMQEQFAWLRDFTHLTFSCNLGMMKPDPEIYRECLAGIGTIPARTLFIDDREENVDGARQAGMQAILFQSPQQLAREVAPIGGLPPVLPTQHHPNQEA